MTRATTDKAQAAEKPARAKAAEGAEPKRKSKAAAAPPAPAGEATEKQLRHRSVMRLLGAPGRKTDR